MAGSIVGRLVATKAALVLGDKRSVLLLVATDLDKVPRILSRFKGAMARRSTATMKGYKWHAIIVDVDALDSDKPWDALFDEMQGWPSS